MVRLHAQPRPFGGCPCADCCNGRQPRTTAAMYGDSAMRGTYVMDLHSRHMKPDAVLGSGLDVPAMDDHSRHIKHDSVLEPDSGLDVPAISALDVEETRKECGRCKVMKHEPDFLRSDWKCKRRVWDSTKCRMCVSCVDDTCGIMTRRKQCGRCKRSKKKAAFLKNDWARRKRAWKGTKCRLCSSCVQEVKARKPVKKQDTSDMIHPVSSGSSEPCITLSMVHGQTASTRKSSKDVHLIEPA